MKSRGILDKFHNIVADAGYGSEYNYSILEENYSDKDYQIPYTLYEKEQTRKYKKDPSKIAIQTSPVSDLTLSIIAVEKTEQLA